MKYLLWKDNILWRCERSETNCMHKNNPACFKLEYLLYYQSTVQYCFQCNLNFDIRSPEVLYHIRSPRIGACSNQNVLGSWGLILALILHLEPMLPGLTFPWLWSQDTTYRLLPEIKSLFCSPFLAWNYVQSHREVQDYKQLENYRVLFLGHSNTSNPGLQSLSSRQIECQALSTQEFRKLNQPELLFECMFLLLL